MSGTVLVTGAGGQVGRALLAAAWPAGLVPLGLSRAALDIADGEAVARALEESGAVALVNAAAYTAVDKAESEPAAAWRGNAEAVALLAAATARRGIPLLQLSTDFVFDGSKGAPYLEDDAVNPLSVYGASKAALEHLTRSMAREWISHGINVNAINPGYIETDINRAMFRSPAGQKAVESLPRQRLGTPEALDGALLLLSSPASAFITGSTITVDDGQRFSGS